MLQRLSDEFSVTLAEAKNLFTIAYTTANRVRINGDSSYFANFDTEAKRVQIALMWRPELSWILPGCKHTPTWPARSLLDCFSTLSASSA